LHGHFISVVTLSESAEQRGAVIMYLLVHPLSRIIFYAVINLYQNTAHRVITGRFICGKIHCSLHRVKTKTNWKCGPMPNVMVALPNIGRALCSTPQSLADAHY